MILFYITSAKQLLPVCRFTLSKQVWYHTVCLLFFARLVLNLNYQEEEDVCIVTILSSLCMTFIMMIKVNKQHASPFRVSDSQRKAVRFMNEKGKQEKKRKQDICGVPVFSFCTRPLTG